MYITYETWNHASSLKTNVVKLGKWENNFSVALSVSSSVKMRTWTRTRVLQTFKSNLSLSSSKKQQTINLIYTEKWARCPALVLLLLLGPPTPSPA